MENQQRPTAYPPEGSLVHDRLWLWGHDTGSHNDGWGLPGPSRITPVAAASYLRIPNLIMVRYQGRPPLPLDQYALALRTLRRVVWSAVGAHGQTDEAERAHVLDLAACNPNVTGIMLDDFFGEKPGRGEESAVLSLDGLRELRSRLSASGRRLDLWGVVYEYQLDQRLSPLLELFDFLSLWAWDATKVPGIKDSLRLLDTLATSCKKILGCYMWDYARKRPMPLDLAEEQCQTGLELLRQGRIEGIIFLASCICDLGLEAVEWTRGWIAKVGNQPV
jgi:hypothetical protein